MTLIGVAFICVFLGANNNSPLVYQDPWRDLEIQQPPHLSFQIMSFTLGKYKTETGRYPSTEDGLKPARDILRAIEIQVGLDFLSPKFDEDCIDAWGNSFKYILSRGVPVFISMGPDEIGGTDDDEGYILKDHFFYLSRDVNKLKQAQEDQLK